MSTTSSVLHDIIAILSTVRVATVPQDSAINPCRSAQIIDMDTNDINRRVRYALSLDDDDVLALLELAHYPASASLVSAWRLKEADEGFALCPPAALEAMLAGLITQRRGPAEPVSQTPKGVDPWASAKKTAMVNAAKPLESVDNNVLLKQLRIALSLKTDDVHKLIEAGGGKVSKSEVTALFRKSDARNYRRCGDQVLRWFLNGLTTLREE